LNVFRLFLSAIALLLLAGCQEFRGPVWSPDGQAIAYTVYTRNAKGGVDTDVYLALPEGDDPPKLIASGATMPQWSNEGSFFYFLGERDAQGFYTKIMKYKLGAEQPEVALGGVHLTSMQLAAASAGPLILLSQGRDAQPGSAVHAELWNAGENKRTDLRALGEMYGPALSYNGKVLVYGTKPADGHAVLMGYELAGGAEAKAIFPTPESQETDADGFVVHAFPNSERFLFYGPGLTGVWAMQGRPNAARFMKFAIPEGLTCPIMARVAEDGNSAALTMLRAAPGKMFFESYKLDLVQRKWSRLESDTSELIGGPVLDPKLKKGDPARYAWLSPAGLAIGDAAKPRVLPVTPAQHLSASLQALKNNDAPKALELALKAQDLKPPLENPEALNQALYAAYFANKNFDRATDIFEQSWLLEPITSTGPHYIFPPDSSLPPPPAEWIASQIKMMDELVAANPDARMIPVLKDAMLARIKGQHRRAMEIYQRAIDLCPDKARVGGVRFQQGLCDLEMGDANQAAEMFEQAAGIEDFPQADFAAAYGAMAYALAGRAEAANKASRVLQLPAAKKSPLAAEMAQIPMAIKGRVFKTHGQSKEAVSADGQSSAWVEFDDYWIPFGATKATPLEQADGTFVPKRFGVNHLTASAIFSNKQATPIFSAARPLNELKLSPSGNLLAFEVSGEVFPVGDQFCELFVIDLQGKVHYGNAQAAVQGKTKGRHIINDFTWNSDSELKISGLEVDDFGAQRPFEKTQPLGRLK